MVSWYGRKQLVSVYIEHNFNFYLSRDVKPPEINIDDDGRAARSQVQRKL